MLPEKIIRCIDDRSMEENNFVDIFNIFVSNIIFILDYPKTLKIA